MLFSLCVKNTLRHAYNIRGHQLGINQKMLANSLGHGLQMNSTTYLKHQSEKSKLQGLQQAITDAKNRRNEVERLHTENEHLKAEIEKLRAELAMYKVFDESQRLK